MKNKEDFKDYYKKKEVTGSYDSQREATEYRRIKRKNELLIFLDLINKKEGDDVLEIGCSSGVLTKYLGNVTAIDTSLDMLKLAKKKNPKATLFEADMFRIDKLFEEEGLDTIVTQRVWNHLKEEELREMMKKSFKILKKKGYLIFDIESKNWLRRTIHLFYKKIFRITGFKIYQYSYEEIKKILEDEGFKLKRIEYLKHRVGNQMIFKAQKI